MHALVHKIAACIIFILCAAWYGHAHFYRDPGSVFFDKNRAYEQKYSHYRKAEVEQFISSQSGLNSQDSSAKAGRNATLCVAISSVKREHSQYLEVCIPWHALQLCTDDSRPRLAASCMVLLSTSEPICSSAY